MSRPGHKGKTVVMYLTDHHGQYDPTHPWCEVYQTEPGMVPGEPRNGIRIHRSWNTRERAVDEVAGIRAYTDPRYERAKANLDELFRELFRKHRAIVDEEAPREPDVHKPAPPEGLDQGGR